jgi:hypothetical protein
MMSYCLVVIHLIASWSIVSYCLLVYCVLSNWQLAQGKSLTTTLTLILTPDHPNPNRSSNRNLNLNLNPSLSKMAIYLLSPLSKFPGLTFSLSRSLSSFLLILPVTQYPYLRSLLQVIGDPPQLMLPLSILHLISSSLSLLLSCIGIVFSFYFVLSCLVVPILSRREVSCRVVSCVVLT